MYTEEQTSERREEKKEKEGERKRRNEASNISGGRLCHEASVMILVGIVDDLLGALIRGGELEKGEEKSCHREDLEGRQVNDVKPRKRREILLGCHRNDHHP